VRQIVRKLHEATRILAGAGRREGRVTARPDKESLEQICADSSHVVMANGHSAHLGITIPHGDWLLLLGISHGAYLAQKAGPKAPSGLNN
jgi:hypothetical protein